MRIKMLTGCEGECVHKDFTAANLGEYCSRWGHEFVSRFEAWAPLDRPAREHPLFFYLWRKHTLIKEEFHDCDWLVWLDADCMILNMTTPLARFLVPGCDLVLTGPFGQCDCGAPTYSAGVMMLRVCDWCRELLDAWWASEDVDWRGSANRDCRTLGDNNWFSCKFLADPANLAHVNVVAPEVAGYYTRVRADQFLIHLYGSTGESRLQVMQTYAPEVLR